MTADLTAHPGLDDLLARQDPSIGDPILDNAVWAALTGPQARFAERRGLASRYDPDVSVFVALADPANPQAWADAAQLIGPGESFALAGSAATVPAGWTWMSVGGGVQLVDVALEKGPDPETSFLGPEDVPEMLALVARNRPGPFRPRTIELGTYLGIRRGGELIAMAGERLHPPGWTEISAVCTDPAYRGQGLGTRLVRAVAHGIAERGDRPFMHAAASNTNAIRLYESIGFRLRRVTDFLSVTVPEA
nr:GNAT family N-acetyltransferase [Nakamurella panacisegetis]